MQVARQAGGRERGESAAHQAPPRLFRRTTATVAPTANNSTTATGASQPGAPPEPESPPSATPVTGPWARLVVLLLALCGGVAWCEARVW
jgi:hypothetical protein